MVGLLNTTKPRAAQHPSHKQTYLKSAVNRLRFLSAGDRRLILHAQRRLEAKRLRRGIETLQPR